MRRRRYYGKPPPSKKQVQAHYDFYAQVDEVVKQEDVEMSIECDKDEKEYLLKLVMTDLQRMDHLYDHAAAHGQEVYLPYHSLAANIKIDLLNHLKNDVES